MNEHGKASFDLDIYSASAIKQGIVDYQDIAGFSVTKNDNIMILQIVWAKFDEEVTLAEFANYVLQLSIRR